MVCFHLGSGILNTQQDKQFDKLYVWVIQTIFSLQLLFGCCNGKLLLERIGRGPGQQRPPAGLLTYRVLLEIGLLLVKDKEEVGSRYKEKEIRGRLEVLV